MPNPLLGATGSSLMAYKGQTTRAGILVSRRWFNRTKKEMDNEGINYISKSPQPMGTRLHGAHYGNSANCSFHSGVFRSSFPELLLVLVLLGYIGRSVPIYLPVPLEHNHLL